MHLHREIQRQIQRHFNVFSFESLNHIWFVWNYLPNWAKLGWSQIERKYSCAHLSEIRSGVKVIEEMHVFKHIPILNRPTEKFRLALANLNCYTFYIYIYNVEIMYITVKFPQKKKTMKIMLGYAQCAMCIHAHAHSHTTDTYTLTRTQYQKTIKIDFRFHNAYVLERILFILANKNIWFCGTVRKIDLFFIDSKWDYYKIQEKIKWKWKTTKKG